MTGPPSPRISLRHVVAHYEPEPPLPSPARHPLGKGAERGVNYHTTEVRNVLVDNLRRYFAGDLTDTRGCRAYGKLRADYTVAPEGPVRDGNRVVTFPTPEMVTRLELAVGLERLARDRPRPYDKLMLYVLGEHILGEPVEPNAAKRRPLSRRDIATLDHHEYRTISAWINEALDYLIDIIWRDE